MPEPDAPVKDPEPDSVSFPDRSRPRSPVVDAAALGGGALFGAGSAYVFFHLSLSWPAFGPARFVAAYDALVGGLLGFCLGVRAVLGVAGAGSVMGSRFLPVVGAAYLGALARLVLVRFVPTHLSFVTLVLPFVGGLSGYLLNPGREGAGASPQSVTLPRLAKLSLTGLVGGVVGTMVLGLVGVLIGAGSAGGSWTEVSGAFAIIGFGAFCAVSGMALGIAMGLRAAGAKLGIQGRFWPAVVTSFIAALAGIGLWLVSRPMRWAGSVPAYYLTATFPLILSLVGGLVGYLGSRAK